MFFDCMINFSSLKEIKQGDKNENNRNVVASAIYDGIFPGENGKNR